MRDISEYYDEKLAALEIEAWEREQHVKKIYLPFLLPLIERHGVKQVVEFGCGPGYIADGLPKGISYVGIDKNKFFVGTARGADRAVALGDIRLSWGIGAWDLSICYGVLKHFSLDEFDSITKKVILGGRFSSIEYQEADSDFDNGTDFHHAFVTSERIDRIISECGRKILASHVFIQNFPVADHGIANSVALFLVET